MTNQELNKYIKHYLENDKTHSAIMLSGEWGSGKSYYIQHELIPFLNADGVDRCVTVSLYGFSNLSEISKNIYLEMRIQNKPIKKASSLLEKLFKKRAKEIVTYHGSCSRKNYLIIYNTIFISLITQVHYPSETPTFTVLS